MVTVLEFLGISFVTSVVYCATQSDEPRVIAWRTARLFIAITAGVGILAGVVAVFSNL